MRLHISFFLLNALGRTNDMALELLYKICIVTTPNAKKPRFIPPLPPPLLGVRESCVV